MTVLDCDEQLADLDACVTWAMELHPHWRKHEPALREVLSRWVTWRGVFTKGTVLHAMDYAIHNGRTAGYWQHKPSTTDRQIGLMKERKTLNCAVCGKTVPMMNSAQKYCGQPCYKKALRQRDKESGK
ncbi:MAG: hypothetical protein Q7O66_02035 [Dehalococcoidia bacterium]|nr:hypothetical protein [Dehalococcoidia bacterium]